MLKRSGSEQNRAHRFRSPVHGDLSKATWPGGGAGCRDGGGLAASTFRWGCRFALSAPPFGLRTAKRQPQRKPRQNTKNPSKEQKPKRPQERKNRKETLRRINNLGGARPDDQKGPNQVDKAIRSIPIELTLYNVGQISSAGVIAYLRARNRKTAPPQHQ